MKDSLLITCPKCGHRINGRLWRCPECGDTEHKQEKAGRSRGGFWSWIVATLRARIRNTKKAD